MINPAVPFGNPANLVVIDRLRLGLGETTVRLLPAAAVAALICAGLVAITQRRQLGGRLGVSGVRRAASPPSAVAGLAGASRIGVQILALLVVLLPVVHSRHLAAAGPGSLLVVALAVSALAATANNLPASAVVATALAPGPAGYAALVGLSIGALATPQGSVATLIAGDLAAENPHARVLAPAALAAAAAATLVVWLLGA